MIDTSKRKIEDKKTLIKNVSILLGIIIVLTVLLIGVPTKQKEETTINNEQEPETLIQVEKAPALFTKEEFDNYYSINNDYIGQIVFESEIINEPVMYSDINSYYLRKNINKEYSIQGSVYLDDRNSTYDQNMILYGHYTEPGYTDYEGYDPDVRPMFSNLELLLEKENYEDNKYVYLYLKDEAIKYEVVCVYYCPLIQEEESKEYVYVTDGYEYYLTDYSEEEFNTYKNTIKENQRYHIDADFSNYDKFLTLQTCVYARDDLREIVLCKEISRATYE